MKRLKPSKEFAAMLMVSLIVILLAAAYMILVGIPMTQARNSYNAAQRAYDDERYDEAKEFIDESISVWDTDSARELRTQVNDALEDQNSSE